MPAAGWSCIPRNFLTDSHLRCNAEHLALLYCAVQLSRPATLTDPVQCRYPNVEPLT